MPAGFETNFELWEVISEDPGKSARIRIKSGPHSGKEKVVFWTAYQDHMKTQREVQRRLARGAPEGKQTVAAKLRQAGGTKAPKRKKPGFFARLFRK